MTQQGNDSGSTSMQLHNLSEFSERSSTFDQTESCDKHLLTSAKNLSSINISFSDISYTVNSWTPHSPFKSEKKKILKEISGDFQASELTGIIGLSGSGKSSLLDILSGYLCHERFTGQVLHNGSVYSPQQLRRHTAYIMQECYLHPLLTVKEAMIASAHFKLNRKYASRERLAVVMEVLLKLDLIQRSEAPTHTLSGGEMKRLAIALELVANPPIMFFDEPTSGLDYHTAKKCLVHLKQLAAAGHNIVCTLHQPSASMFKQLDHVYVISDGRCVYQGSPQYLIGFLEEINLSCPKHYNPADYILDVAMGEYGPCNDLLVSKSNKGKSKDWRAEVLSQAYANTCIKEKDQLDRQVFFTQLLILINIRVLEIYRDRFQTYFRLIIYCVSGVLIGVVFQGVGSDAACVFKNFRVLSYSLLFLAFTAYTSMVMSIQLEMPILIREHFNHWYSFGSYFLALTISETPVQVLCTIIHCLIVYCMTHQPLELFRFGLYLLLSVFMCLFTQALGTVVGCATDIKHAVIYGTMLIMPWVCFSGFFVLLKDAPSFLHWIFYLSSLKYGVDGVMVTIYGYDRGFMPCVSDNYCHFRWPMKFLKQLGMDNASYYTSLFVIIGHYLVTKILMFFVLRYQFNHKKTRFENLLIFKG